MSQNKRANIVRRGQYLLWPDENGIITLPQRLTERLNASQLRRSRPSLRVVKVKAWPSPRLLSLRSSLLSRNSVGAFFGEVVESIFGIWLSNLLAAEYYNALEVDQVLKRAGADLGLEDERARRLLISATSPAGNFESDGQIVTFRG